MCTVSFIARRRGYLLGMNRDEQLTRAKGLPPTLRSVDGVRVISPFEPGGGTWIALNEFDVTLALVNWYSITARVRSNPISRGEVVKTTCVANSPGEVESVLKILLLRQVNPFRLIGVFPEKKKVVQWRWNLRKLERKDHAWQAQQWISSGFDEPKAQRVRSRTFRLSKMHATFGSTKWLRRLHGSHAPECGPFSTCMHRADAATVSYTEVAVSPGAAAVFHCVGAPCQNAVLSVRRLPHRRSLPSDRNSATTNLPGQ